MKKHLLLFFLIVTFSTQCFSQIENKTIKILHKEYHYEGVVIELKYFFVYLKTRENEIITIPNSHFFDKSFSVSENKEKTNPHT